MTVKKIGKGKVDLATGLWSVEAKPEQFMMNQRLVDTRPDVKRLKSAYSRHAAKRTPSTRRPEGREEHLQRLKNLKMELKKLLTEVYREILKDSFSYPIPLRKDKDYDHKSDWRYCLYQGIIYQFDRPDYGGDEMIEQISQSMTGTREAPAA